MPYETLTSALAELERTDPVVKKAAEAYEKTAARIIEAAKAMHYQKQTTFGGAESSPEERGNCFAACIASLIGVPLKKVPNFMAIYQPEKGEADPWYDNVLEWLGRFGLVLMSYESDPFLEAAAASEMHKRTIMVASGPGPRGHRHCVLWRYGKLHHDPHPSDDGLVGPPDLYEVLVVVDGAQFIRALMAYMKGSA
jgi:hypothetical protein